MDIRGISVWRDLRAKRWTIEDKQHTYTLQEWNWGLRHQLVRTAIVTGQLDRELFIENVFSVLVDPQPVNDHIRLAFTFLHLLNVPEQTPPVSLARAELLLAQAFGWRPDDLKEQNIASLDNMVRTLEEQHRQRYASQQHNDGWKSIIFAQAGTSAVSTATANDGPVTQDANIDAVLRVRLQNMLDAVASWAGLALEPELETAEQGFVRQQPQVVKTAQSNSTVSLGGKTSAFNETAGLNEPTVTFFKGTARLKASHSKSTRAQENVSAANPVAHLNHVNSDSGSQQIYKNTAILARTTHPGDSESERDAIESLTNTFTRAVATHKRYAVPKETVLHKSAGNITPAPGVSIPSIQPHNNWRSNAVATQLNTDLNSINRNAVANHPVNHNSDWQHMHGNLPSQQRIAGQVHPANGSVLPQYLAPGTFTGVSNWPHSHENRKISVASSEAYFASIPPSIAMRLQHSLKENPFALSEFEEQLADALERAAREAGIDIP
jgi:hypothetical protein